LEGALGICEIYNDILAAARTVGDVEKRDPASDLVCGGEMLRWSINQGQSGTLRRHRYMSVTGLSNIMQVFDDIEKGKLRNIEYLECDACWGGCVSGNLTVDNAYVTLSKVHRLLAELPESGPRVETEVERRYPNEDLSLKGRVRPRVTERSTGGLRERVRRIKAEQAFLKALPGLDCGLCGAPTCEAFAKDVAEGSARHDECVFFSDERIRQLRETYSRSTEPSPEDER
jgi:hypothetical protein